MVLPSTMIWPEELGGKSSANSFAFSSQSSLELDICSSSFFSSSIPLFDLPLPTGVLTTLPGIGTAWNFRILGVLYGCLVLAIGEISSKLCCLGANQVLEEP